MRGPRSETVPEKIFGEASKSARLSSDRVVSDGGTHVVGETIFLGEVLLAHRDGADQHAPVYPAVSCRLR